MDGCIYQTEEKRCIKFTNGKSQSWCVGKEAPCGYRKPSNADRIRAMTDEEFAELLNRHNFCAHNFDCEKGKRPCGECNLEWLKQDAEEGK